MRTWFTRYARVSFIYRMWTVVQKKCEDDFKTIKKLKQ